MKNLKTNAPKYRVIFVVSSVSNFTKSLQESLSPAILRYLGVFSSTAAAAVNSATFSVVVNSKI
jgi:Na+/serine symporter